jgi:hypothetical protein
LNKYIFSSFLTENMGVIQHLPSSSSESVVQQHQQLVTPPAGEIYESKMGVTDFVEAEAVEAAAALKVEKNDEGHYLCSECKKSFTRLDSLKQVSLSCPAVQSLDNLARLGC